MVGWKCSCFVIATEGEPAVFRRKGENFRWPFPLFWGKETAQLVKQQWQAFQCGSIIWRVYWLTKWIHLNVCGIYGLKFVQNDWCPYFIHNCSESFNVNLKSVIQHLWLDRQFRLISLLHHQNSFNNQLLHSRNQDIALYFNQIVLYIEMIQDDCFFFYQANCNPMIVRGLVFLFRSHLLNHKRWGEGVVALFDCSIM